MIDVPCELRHLLSIQVQYAQEDQVSDFSRGSELFETHARTLLHGDTVMACFGVMPLWDGVGQAWSVLSDAVLKDHPIELSRRVKYWLSNVEKREGIYRIQAAIADGHWEGIRWIKWLGFEHEGVMRNYGLQGHGDFHLYARIH